MKKRILFLISFILILALMFSACGNKPSETDTSTDSETESIVETDSSTETTTETETKVETETETTTETNTDTETGTTTDTETETETEVESETETATETETETKTETEVDKAPVELLINEDISLVGCITFDIRLESISGEYALQFASANKEVLPYYSNIAKGTLGEADTSITIEALVLPKDCKYIKMTTENDSYFLEIPAELTVSSEKLYRFGALSDVHYNRGDFFNHALDFLDDQSVDFVAVSGDLTNDGELEYLQKFNEAIKGREYKVYTTTGNHDIDAVVDGSWLENINTGIKTDTEIVEIAENGLDFVYKPDGLHGDVFVFLCQVRWDYLKNQDADPTKYTLLDKSQLEWLSGVLEEYKENSVFLFFHTFLSDPEGGQADAVGNLLNPGGYSYDLPYKYGTADEIEFRNLLKQYKNVVFFSGHSHWMFEMEIYNENVNFSNFDGEYSYMVHVPSVSEPRWIGENDTSRTSKTGEASEGWIVDVTNEAIIFTPVDFISEIYYTEYMKIIPLK